MCYNYEKKGHIASACKALLQDKSKQNQMRGVHNLSQRVLNLDYTAFTQWGMGLEMNFQTKVKMNNQYITMRFDTAAYCTMKHKDTYEQAYQ